MVVDSEAVLTLEPVDGIVPGLQSYVIAPDAFKLTEAPWQILTSGQTVSVG